MLKLEKDLKVSPGKPQGDQERIRDFQRKLYQKAKQEPEFRFYALYDKICSERFLREAYRKVKVNQGAAGVDGITFKDVERAGLDGFIGDLAIELREHRYRPMPVRRVYIEKANGKLRPLGIPTIRDRVVQMSCKLVIEPIFEADFEDTSYGFRPKRSTHDAMSAIKDHLKAGRTEVYDADLSAYFDTIPHEKLMQTVALRVSDKHVLRLIKLWLKSPIEEAGGLKGGKKNKVGTPQGGVISPLLANIYLHLVDRIVNDEGGIYRSLGVHIVRYADDFVLMARKMPEEALARAHRTLGRMGLTINLEKSRLVDARSEPFDFLGFTVRYDRDLRGRSHRYWNIVPSKKALKRIRANIKEYTQKHGHLPPEEVAEGLNAKIRGWCNAYTIPRVSYPQVAKRQLRWYLSDRLMRFYRRKSQRKSKAFGPNAFALLVEHYRLIDPTKYRKLTPVNA
jgi:RNA-directed DNA polymerase